MIDEVYQTSSNGIEYCIGIIYREFYKPGYLEATWTLFNRLEKQTKTPSIKTTNLWK